MATIASFSGPHRFLSNFWPCNVPHDDFVYASTEHAYQAAKTTDAMERACIQMAPRPGQAKSYGRQVKHLRPDWEAVKVGVMLEVLRSKFGENPDLADKLLLTGPAELVEGNYWGDTYWGVCRGAGQNVLGRLLMHVRFELYEEAHCDLPERF